MSEWISVAERLPEKSGNYLTYDRDTDYTTVLGFSKRHELFNAYDCLDETNKALHVTHWMPLPDPPVETP